MTSHEHPLTFTEIHSAAVVKHQGTRGNTNDALRDAVEEILRADDEELLADPIPAPYELRAAWVRSKLQSDARASSAQLDRAISQGQSLLELGNKFDLVIIVCSAKTLRNLGEDEEAGRTTTLGGLTHDDLSLMAIESRANREAVDKADDAKQDVIAAWRPRLSRYANYKQLFEREAEPGADEDRT